ncbi:recombinase family protein [Brevundimonas sp. DC300-4]|uniref:recombinase family protein n=1 Tax=Brevundimonas sp. DC300-4 TaxID=2804594 RepID=UPI003CE9C3E3
MAKEKLRCAIYTRKSSEEGLEQDYNSLHAQRDACEAYVKSQVGEGWTTLKTAYDDGGISGGTMERDGLKQLLADIVAKKIDVVVVYKVDRLTRSLGDFARIVEVFDQHGVSFVSVTQSFNTTTSMGRLTLNVLLSFAQFEREVTGERIRDKIAQSKAKGMWMGGTPPLGYDPKGRALEVNETEAVLVRHIFDRYLALQSVGLLWAELNAEGRLSKAWTTTKGRAMGGLPFDRGAISHILKNPTYIGMIPHKALVHPGNHAPIVERDVFDRVQAELKLRTRRIVLNQSRPDHTAMLKGRLFDMDGVAMTPTTARGKSGQIFRYYVSSTVQRNRPTPGSPDAIRRVPAIALESVIRQMAARLLPGHDDAADRIVRVEIHPRAIHLAFNLKTMAPTARQAELMSEAIATRLDPDESWIAEEGRWWLRARRRMQFRGGKIHITAGGVLPFRFDPVLARGLRKAHAILDASTDAHGYVSKTPDDAYERILIRMAFLAPDLQGAIIAGTQPAGLTLEALRYRPLPLCWDDQHQALATAT